VNPVIALQAAIGTSGPGWTVGQATPTIGLGNLAAVALVLVVLGGLAWLVRRGTIRLPGRRREQAVSVETAVSLGDHRSLVIVAVEGRRLLLGLTPGQVSLVTELQAAPPAFDAALSRQLSPSTGREFA
jgi:flagellar biosynthetic protein FliO